jgi:type II secretory pathway component PulF
LALELVELRRRLGVALTYPFVVGIVAYGLFLTIITATLEQFRATFVDFGYRIPPALELLFQASRLLERAWWAPLLALAACLLWWVSTGASHLFDLSGLARPLALVPGMAAIGRHYRCAHFAELLALLVEHAVPLPRALRLASGAAGDSQLRAGVEELAQRVEQADAAPARRRRGRLPRYLAWIISHGARQRDWPRLLRHAASIHRRRALAGANWLKLLLPVACSVLMGGGIVICYAAATFGPIAALWLSLGAD